MDRRGVRTRTLEDQTVRTTASGADQPDEHRENSLPSRAADAAAY